VAVTKIRHPHIGKTARSPKCASLYTIRYGRSRLGGLSNWCFWLELAALGLALGVVTAMLQVLAFGGVVGQVDRAVVGGYGLLDVAELVEQVCPDRPGRLEATGLRTGIV